MEHPLNILANSGDDAFGDFPRHVSQPEIAALEAESQSLMIDATKIKHGGVQIMNVHLLTVFKVAIAQFIGLAPGQSAFSAPARKPDGKSIDVMVSPSPLPH